MSLISDPLPPGNPLQPASSIQRASSLQPASLLQIENLNVWFDLTHSGRSAENRGGAAHVVRDVSLTLAPGERFALVGESGSGKTTTILAAMGLLPSTASVSGRILFQGHDILARADASVAPHRWRDIAMVFQGAMNAFNPVKSIGWQIAEALEVHGKATGPAAKARVAELLSQVGIAPDRHAWFPHQFSGGMRQRAMIAMALACEPKILLADEPTTALDVLVQDQIARLLIRLSEDLGLAVLLVTHDLGVVAQICQRAAVLLNGEVVEQGLVADLYHRPRHPYTRQLFRATPNLAMIADPGAGLTGVKGQALLSIRDLAVTYPGAAPRPKARIRTWFKATNRNPYGANPSGLNPSGTNPSGLNPSGTNSDALHSSGLKPAVDGVSIDVRRGEMVALVGQSGSGKTTTLQAVLGMVRASGGSILLNGQDVTRLTSRQWRPLRRQVQMIYQDPYEALDNRFRVGQAVEEPLHIHGIGANRAERGQLVEQALERVGLSPAATFLNRYPHELSGGQRQRVAIAASIILKPALLLADEPVSMLDVSVRDGILDLLASLRRDAAMGILMITHDLSTAAGHADRIAVMQDGRIVEVGTATEVINAPKSAYTKALLASIPSPDPEVPRRW